MADPVIGRRVCFAEADISAGGCEAPDPRLCLFPPSSLRWDGLKIAAVLLLSVGGFLIPIGAPAARLVCAWISTSWTTREKWIATVIFSLVSVWPLLAVVFSFLLRSN